MIQLLKSLFSCVNMLMQCSIRWVQLVNIMILLINIPHYLGGAIWEWQDQGIYNRRDPNHQIIAYGGGFGEFPNDNYFIHKGVVASDRSLKPHYPEMKNAYQWIKVTAEDLAKGQFLIQNKYQFINLSGFTASWTLSENGTEISRGDIKLPVISSGKGSCNYNSL